MFSPRITKAANYTLLKTDAVVDFDATGAARTATLPADADLDAIFVVAKVDSGPNAVTVVPSGVHTINGGSSLALASKDDVAGFQSLGNGNFRTLWKSVAISEKPVDIVVIASLAASLNVDFAFAPTAILAFWSNGDGTYGSIGFAKGSSAVNQGCLTRRGADDLRVWNNALVAHHNGTGWTCGPLGTTTTLTRYGSAVTITNILLIALR